MNKSLKKYVLRITNQGANCRENIANQSWSVSLPPSLRDKGCCSIKVVQGSMYADIKSEDTGVEEYGIESLIGIQGYSTETPAGSNNFTSEQYKTLFVANSLGNVAEEFVLQTPYSFHSAGLPETLDFNSYKVNRKTGKVPLTCYYVSFTLEIDFLE